MVEINKYDELKKAYQEHELCLVKIGTTWCGPCKVVQINMENIENLHPNVYFISVNADNADDAIIDEYSIRSIPVTLVVKNGEVVSREVGLQTETQLIERLN